LTRPAACIIDLVHIPKIVDIRKIDVYRDDIFQLKTGLFHNAGNIVESGLRLLADAAGLQFALLIGALLAGNIERVAHDNAIAERKSFPS
jgi:hypothetical protein